MQKNKREPLRRTGRIFANTRWLRPCAAECAAAIVLILLAGCGGNAPSGNDNAPPTGANHSVGGTVKGLIAPGLILKLNGASDLSVDLDRAFSFADPVPSGKAYVVTIHNEPDGQQCKIDSGSNGTMPDEPVVDVIVSCAALPSTQPDITIAGTVSGLSKPGLTLLLATDDNLGKVPSIRVDNDGDFAFPSLLRAGIGFTLVVPTDGVPPGLGCDVVRGAGGIAGSSTPVTVKCAPPPVPGTATRSIGGSVSGLDSAEAFVSLLLNGQTPTQLRQNGSFTFDRALPVGSEYQVTVLDHPRNTACAVSNDSGVVAAANTTNVAITCKEIKPDTTPILLRGTVAGLVGSGLKLRQGPDTITVPPGARDFSFPTPPTALLYAVQILEQPRNPSQACTAIAGANVGTFEPGRDASPVRLRCTTIQEPQAARALTLDRDTVTFSAEQGGTIAPQSVFGRWTGFDNVVDVRAELSDSSLLSIELHRLSKTSGIMVLRPRPPDGLSPGVHSATVTVSVCLDTSCSQQAAGSPRTISVAYTVDANRPTAALNVSARSIAFAAVGGAAPPRRVLTVSDTSTDPSVWIASTAAPWLRVTPNGTAGGALVVTADPTALPNGFHQADISVRSANPAITRTETVRVGLYKSAESQPARLVDPLPQISLSSVPDPFRPLFYQAGGDTIVAHHAYTGQRTRSLRIPAATIESVAVSDDGSRMYLLDVNRSVDGASPRVIVVDLDTLTVHHKYTLRQLGQVHVRRYQMVHAVVDGRRVLILAGEGLVGRVEADLPPPVNPVVNADTGAIVGTLHGLDDFATFMRLAPSRNHPTAYAFTEGISGGNLMLKRIELRSNSLGNVFGEPVGDPIAYDRLRAIEVSPDGNHLVLDADLPFQARLPIQELIWDGSAHVPGRQFAPSTDLVVTMDFDAYGRLLVHRIPREFNANNSGSFDLYDAAGSLVRQFASTSGANVTAISADGFRLLFADGQLLDLAP